MANNPLTEAERAAFLDALRRRPIVTVAARAVGREPAIFRSLIRRDEKFATEVNDAIAEGRDVLENEAMRRAYDGIKKAVFYKGEEIKTDAREYSDRLLEFLLIGAFPEKYAKRPEQQKVAATDQEWSTNELARRIAHMMPQVAEHYRGMKEPLAVGKST